MLNTAIYDADTITALRGTDMRDLDWGDVQDDANAMRDAYFEQRYEDLQTMGEEDLLEARYYAGIRARNGDQEESIEVRMINSILFEVNQEEEPWDDGSWYADAYNRELEAESLGRPLFPNEY